MKNTLLLSLLSLSGVFAGELQAASPEEMLRDSLQPRILYPFNPLD